MGKTAEEILLEIEQLQAQLDQAEQLLRTIKPELAAALPESLHKPHGPKAMRRSVAERSIGQTPLAVDGQTGWQISRIQTSEQPPRRVDGKPESRDEDRTAQLTRINKALKQRVARHRRAEQDLRHANEALQASEQHYRRIVETAEEGVWILDDRNETAFVNQKMAQMLGYSVEGMLGKPITAFTDAEGSGRIGQALRRRRQGQRETYDMRFVRQDGQDLWALVCTTPILDENGSYAGTLKMITDITERKRLERQIAGIAQREQQRIGRDLHDVLGQTLTGIAFLSKTLHQRLATQSRPEASEVEELAGLASQSLKQVRSLAKGLQRVPAGPDGLRKALGEYVSDVESLYGVACRFECARGVRLADHGIATHLYHITQEAVLNAVKHGQATAITIRLRREPGGRLELDIASNGIDFPGESAKRGLGLRIMHQRAAAIGASLRVERGPAGGTLVACSVPGTTTEAEVESRHGNSTGSDQ